MWDRIRLQTSPPDRKDRQLLVSHPKEIGNNCDVSTHSISILSHNGSFPHSFICAFSVTGSGILTLRGPKIRQEAWVTVWVSRDGQDTSLTSNDHRVTGHTPGVTSGLKLNSDLWVGAVNGSVGLPDVLPSREGFIGCVQHVKVCLDGCLWQRIRKCRL